MKEVYILQHLHIIDNYEEDVKFIGVYSTKQKALEAINFLKNQPGFKGHSKLINYDTESEEEGFLLEKYKIDATYWSEGFINL